MASAPSAETVYFVPRRDILAGSYPLAEPVLLVDADLADQYVGVRELVVAETRPNRIRRRVRRTHCPSSRSTGMKRPTMRVFEWR